MESEPLSPITILERLVAGKDPFTEERLPPDHLINTVGVSSALWSALATMDLWEAQKKLNRLQHHITELRKQNGLDPSGRRRV